MYSYSFVHRLNTKMRRCLFFHWMLNLQDHCGFSALALMILSVKMGKIRKYFAVTGSYKKLFTIETSKYNYREFWSKLWWIYLVDLSCFCGFWNAGKMGDHTLEYWTMFRVPFHLLIFLSLILGILSVHHSLSLFRKTS